MEVTFKDIQKANSQELTEEGEKLFREMFAQPSDAVQQIENLTRDNEKLKLQIKELEHQLELEKEKHEGTRKILERADNDIEFMRLAVSQAQEAVSRTTLLLESERQKQTGGLLARLLGRKENTK